VGRVDTEDINALTLFQLRNGQQKGNQMKGLKKHDDARGKKRDDKRSWLLVAEDYRDLMDGKS